MGDYRYFKENSATKSGMAVLLNPCFYSVKLYRISNLLFKKKLAPIAKIIWFINRVVFSVDIDYRATIGKNFIIVHGIGIVIGCEVVIGDNCKIYQGVTIGGDSGKKRVINNKEVGQPIIKDGVIVYSNSILVGPIIVGENSIIGSNSFVNRDVNKNVKYITKKEFIEYSNN